MRTRVPTSVVLNDLLKDAPPNVTVGWVLGRLQERSFGLVMLLLALIAIERLRAQPGFRESPNSLEMSDYALDKDYWAEGFSPALD